VHVLIQGPELMVNPHTPLRGDGEVRLVSLLRISRTLPPLMRLPSPWGQSESSAHQATQFISDAFFSRLKFEVLFQTQKFDAKLHALQFLAKGKGKPSLTDTRWHTKLDRCAWRQLLSSLFPFPLSPSLLTNLPLTNPPKAQTYLWCGWNE